MKRYKAYKKVDVDWIDYTPADWDTKKIKYLFSLRNERNHLPMDKVRLLSLYTELGVLPHDELEKTTGNKAVTVEEYKKVYEDDIVVNIILCWMGAIGISKYEGVTSPAYDIYQPISPDIDSRYYHHLFRTPMFSGACYKVGRGIMAMRWRTYSDEFRSIKVPVPPIAEQRVILGFLDTKTTAIDTLIADKKKLIDLLKEKRQAIISEAVTKGLDKNAKMKDSGIEWIGEMPKDWDVKRIKDIVFIDAKRLPEKTLPEYEFDYIDIGSITDFAVQNAQHMTFEESPSRARMIVQQGDVIVSTVRTYLKAITYINESNRYICSTGFCVLSPQQILPQYLHYFCLSEYFIQSVVSQSTGVSYPAINSYKIGNIKMPLPNAKMQEHIVEQLDEEIAKIDTLTADIETQIEKLKEYRQSIISEAVTGKVAI